MVRRKTMERMLTDRERAHARERDEWVRERRDLLDRIMYMADRTWTPPPQTQIDTTIADEVEWPVSPDMMMPDEMAELAT